MSENTKRFSAATVGRIVTGHAIASGLVATGDHVVTASLPDGGDDVHVCKTREEADGVRERLQRGPP